MGNMAGTAYPSQAPGFTPGFFCGSVLLICLVFCVVLCFLVLFLFVLCFCVSNVASVSELSNLRFSMTFTYRKKLIPKYIYLSSDRYDSDYVE
jgi:uncharacterized membrane protein